MPNFLNYFWISTSLNIFISGWNESDVELFGLYTRNEKNPMLIEIFNH